MGDAQTSHSGDHASNRGGVIAWYRRTPLYLKILVGMLLGVAVGLVVDEVWAKRLNQPAAIILKLLGAIAPPLILVAVVRALITANVKGRLAAKLFFLLVLNTIVAIVIGLTVANVIRPGKHGSLPPGELSVKSGDPLSQFLENIPGSVLGPLVTNNVIGVIIIAVAIGLAARKLAPERTAAVLSAVDIAFDLIITILHWIIALVPLAVFGKVAYVVGTQGFAPFKALGWFIVAVLLALALQGIYYLTRIKLSSWVRPIDVVRGTRDALVMAFSTASSTATMPVTYECLHKKVGLREESASLGALVGANFNNDGTALYEAMSALFISQMIGQNLSLTDQLLVVMTSVVASVGAAGIPEAGLVTMTLVFNAVHLPIGYIALLLPVDWFLDRCRTAINVMGDMNVSCILDGKKPKATDPPPKLLRPSRQPDQTIDFIFEYPSHCIIFGAQYNTNRLPTTLIDIARETNTSVSTVSRVLAGGAVAQRISEETRARVLEAAKRMGYRPNLLARSLRTRKSNTVALLVSDIGNPFYGRIASYIEQSLYPHGYSLIVCNSGETGQREAEYLEMLPRKGIDGLIVVPLCQSREDLVSHLPANLPMVVLDRLCAGVESWVASDQEQGSRLLCETLAEAGVKKVGLLTGPEQVSTLRVRAQAIAESFTVVARYAGSLTVDIGKESVAAMSGHKLDAVVSTNGYLAEAFLQALPSADKRLVLGSIDNIPMKNLVPMPVACALQDLPGLAEGVVSQLLPQIQNQPFTPGQVLLAMHIESNQAFKDRVSGDLARAKQLATA